MPNLEGEVSKVTAEGFGDETVSSFKNGMPLGRGVNTDSGTGVDGDTYKYFFNHNFGYGQPVQVVKSGNGSESLYTYDYTYDKHGNILTQIEYREFESENQNYDSPGTAYDTEKVREVSYEYDHLDRLTNETVDGEEKSYTYDAAGNIKSKTTIDKTYVFSYNNSWKDQLSRLTVNGVEEQFVYNNIGLPTTYRGKTLIWNDRNLLSNYNGVTFTYDGTGMRLSKGSTTFDYEGDKLISESRNGNEIRYVYGASGVIGFKYNGANYYYVRNLQGDVTRIVNANNQIYAQYVYDAWGNCTIVTDVSGIASLNAIRYRGYYFDSETGLYYLQTRYYDPEIGRFISPDSTKYLDPETLGGLNLYAYCNNNPVMYADSSGCSADTILKISLGIAAIVGLAAFAIGATIISGGTIAPLALGALIGAGTNILGQGIGNLASGNSFFYDFDMLSVALGAVTGAAFATGIGGLGTAMAIGAISNAGSAALKNESWTNIACSFVIGGLASGVAYGVGQMISQQVFKNSGMLFNDYYSLGIIDTGRIKSSIYALMSSWNTFLPNLGVGATRGIFKYIGNRATNSL